MSRLCILGVALLLAGCAVGPDYQQPSSEELSVPKAWHARLPHQGSNAELVHWWQHFDDPVLVRLIGSAQAHNPTLDKAVASVREARASVQTSQSALFPQWTGSATAMRSNGSNSGMGTGTDLSALGTGGATNTISSSPITFFSSALDASWELDVFGGKRRSVEGSVARWESSAAQWHDARVSLAAEVANSYISLRSCQALVTVRTKELASRHETQQLTALKVKVGMAAPVEDMTAAASVADSANTLESQKGSCNQNVNELVQLTGLGYTELEGLLRKEEGTIPVPESHSIPNIPAEILSQRPDVRAAERLLAAASADIGVTLAQRFPSLTLSGSIGINTYRFSGDSISSKTWSLGPAISLPILDGGASAARVESARARYAQALATYRSTVLQAVREVEDALVRINAVMQREQFATQSEDRYKAALRSIEQKNHLGSASLLEVEDTRRNYLISKESLLAVQQERASAWIALYKAVGGGWQMASVPQSSERRR